MPKKRTKRIEDIRQKLIDRVKSGYYHSGDRFFSNRAIAERFGISYKTAHLLLNELEEEGYIARNPQSGTYISGDSSVLYGAALYFNERAKITDSFGYNIYRQLIQALDAKKIKWELIWTDSETKLLDNFYPVIWESPRIQQKVCAKQVFGLLINKKSDPGLSSTWIDSLALDDYSGGVTAAQLMKPKFGNKKVVLFSGPEADYRNNDRVSGFLSILKNVDVISAGTWFYSDGYRESKKVSALEPDAVFACNDRLASSLIDYCSDNNLPVPVVMGFDNAPISEQLNISTIAIPWDSMIELAVRQIHRRLQGDTSPTIHYLLQPRPLIRGRDFS